MSTDNSERLKRVDKSLATVEAKRKKLTDMLLDDKISKEAYDERFDIPRGTAGVANYSTYGFSLMSMFSNQKARDYFIFQNHVMSKIFTEICNNNYNRDNYAWKKLYLNQKCKINPIFMINEKEKCGGSI